MKNVTIEGKYVSGLGLTPCKLEYSEYTQCYYWDIFGFCDHYKTWVEAVRAARKLNGFRLTSMVVPIPDTTRSTQD